MAHQYESGFQVGKPAWHNLGITLEVAPSSASEGIVAAGLDWEVEKRELAYLTQDSTLLNEVPDHNALIRKTDGRVLGVVGKDYEPLQNRDAFEFFNPFLESGLVTFESAGSLKGGKKIWVLAKIKGTEREVINNDLVNGYFLLHNSHDRSSAVGIQFTGIRVVCWNTLSAAMREADKELQANVKIRHSAKMKDALQAVQQIVDLTGKTFSLSVDQYQYLASKRLPIDGLKNYVSEVLQFEPTKKEESPRALKHIEDSYLSGPGSEIKGVMGTYWGAYNAVTHWLDYKRGRSEDSRLDSSWFGQSATLRDRAFQVALNA